MEFSARWHSSQLDNDKLAQEVCGQTDLIEGDPKRGIKLPLLKKK